MTEDIPDDIPWDTLDPGIIPVVWWIDRDGWETFTSCEGGKHHSFNRPVVRVRPPDVEGSSASISEQMTSMARTLCRGGYQGFGIRWRQAYQDEPTPWATHRETFLEVRFWPEQLPCPPPVLDRLPSRLLAYHLEGPVP